MNMVGLTDQGHRDLLRRVCSPIQNCPYGFETQLKFKLRPARRPNIAKRRVLTSLS